MKNALVIEDIPGFHRIAVSDDAAVTIGSTTLTFNQFEHFSAQLDKAYDKAAQLHYQRRSANTRLATRLDRQALEAAHLGEPVSAPAFDPEDTN